MALRIDEDMLNQDYCQQKKFKQITDLNTQKPL